MPQCVLVVDDSPTIRKLVSAVLQRHGLETVLAADGHFALETLARPETRVDMALVDFVMPRMNGFQFCRALRSHHAFRDLPVVLMSAKAEKIRDRFAEQTGAVDAITKPFDPKVLVSAVDNALRHAGKPRGAGFFSPRYTAVEGGASAPALTGDISVIPVGAILQLLQMEGQTGVLAVSTGVREVVIALRDGQIDLAQGRNAPNDLRLGRYFLELGLLTSEELNRLLREQEGDFGPSRIPPAPGESGVAPRPSAPFRGERRPLGHMLIDAGRISRDQLCDALSRQSSELVYELVRWPAGRFEFRREPLPVLAQTARLGLPVAPVVMEGFRRVDEWQLVEASLGSLDAVLQRDDLAALSPDRLARGERAVLEAVNGVRTVREIVAHSHMSSFDACKILFRFLEARIVRRRAA